MKKPWEQPGYKKDNETYLACEEDAWRYLGFSLVDAIVHPTRKHQPTNRTELFDRLSEYRERHYNVAYIADQLAYFQEDQALNDFRQGVEFSKVKTSVSRLLNSLSKKLKELHSIRIILDENPAAETPNAFDRCELVLPSTRSLAKQLQSKVDFERDWMDKNLGAYVRGQKGSVTPRKQCIGNLYSYFKHMNHEYPIQEIQELLRLATGKEVDKRSLEREIARMKPELKRKGLLPPK